MKLATVQDIHQAIRHRALELRRQLPPVEGDPVHLLLETAGAAGADETICTDGQCFTLRQWATEHATPQQVLALLDDLREQQACNQDPTMQRLETRLAHARRAARHQTRSTP